MSGSSVFRMVSLMCLVLYLLGLLNTYFSDKNDYCEMTYMFEYPQFVRITLPDNDYPQYGLYAYAEGRMTEKARKMKFDGIPVLFLPGNSGSHMQSRSLASVALRKALSDAYDYHFDYYTVSFNEDLSALFGGVLHHETDFAVQCINKILDLYKHNRYTKTVPTHVILIGHSMGGVIAKRLLAFPKTINVTNVAIALASPLEAPVVNADGEMNLYYNLIDREWEDVNRDVKLKARKMLLSFGNGARDVLMPPGLTSSNDSDVNALTTSIPGVWVSPDHVSIVWCKQLVLAINRFLFSIVDPQTKQVVEEKRFLMAKARHFFQANRSMTLSPDITRPNVTMIPDAFWYEDNRRVYQILRPEISKMTYLMIRLVNFPQNRFVAIESVNVDDRDWIFGCSAQYTYGTHRYCKQATSLTELSRWSGAAEGAGRRKLATVHLHEIMAKEPSWTHVVVKVSPTRKPIALNVDINDLASRQITVKLPHGLNYGRQIIQQQTEPNSLYYELILPGFNKIHQAFWLHVEPAATCQAKEYHVTAELHVPWAPNHEYFHYFTHAKRSPMKLRLFKTDPNYLRGENASEHVTVTLLLDPQCFFTISISYSWYHQLAQMARNYTPVLIPYMAAILLLVARASVEELRRRGQFMSLHSGLASEYVQPYYALLASRPVAWILASIPVVSVIVQESFSSKNEEVAHLTWSPLSLAIYMVAMGLLNVLAAAVILAMVFSSQLAHRMFYRILWRGRPALVERAAEGLKRVPLAVSIVITLAVPCSCGAASLAIGGAYYAFMLSNMYEEYLEDYVYKLMAKVAARVCCAFKSKKPAPTPTPAESQEAPAIEAKEPLVGVIDSQEVKAIEEHSGSGDDSKDKTVVRRRKKSKGELSAGETSKGETSMEVATRPEMKTPAIKEKEEKKRKGKETDKRPCDVNVDEDDPLLDLNFHMILFSLWMVVTLINVPALITWARNFQYSMVLHPDPSYYTGFVMSGCSATLWQLRGPIIRLKHYEWVSALLMSMAIFLLALGPHALFVVNYGVAFAFALLTLQQQFDTILPADESDFQHTDSNDNANIENDTDGENATDSEQNGTSSGQNNSNSGQDATSNGQNNSNSGQDATSTGQNNSSSGQNATSSGHNISNTKRKESASSEGNQSNSSDNGGQSHHDDVTSNGNDCENVCNENRIYTMFKDLREKFTINEEL